MKFGGLSESEVFKISEILTSEGIPFTIDKDQEIIAFNKASMKNDLRHYAPPNISTHMLAIIIEDLDFSKISESGKRKLLDFGITDVVPDPEDFRPATGESLHKELVDGPRKMVVFNFKHQFVLGLLLLLIFYLIKKFFY